MEAETTSHQERLDKRYVDSRVDEFHSDRRESIATSKLLKTLGFIGTVAGAGLLVAGQAFSVGAILAASTLAKMMAAGEVLTKIGAPVMVFGAIKELFNRHTKP
jgi:hypothetical protein